MTTIILIVDDSPSLRKMLTFILNTHGYKIINAENGQQALDILAEQDAIALLILDLDMPGMSGLEVLQTLRTQPAWEALPVLALSAEADPHEREQALAWGANACMAKPYKPVELLAMVENLLT